MATRKSEAKPTPEQQREINRILKQFERELGKVFRESVTESRAIAEEPKETTGMTLAEIGRQASHAAQRKALLAELEQQRWNLSATARSLGMTNTSNVLRAIRLLDLGDEYEAARIAGKIAPGRPKG